MNAPVRRTRALKATRDAAERRRTVRILVEQFRNTSKRMRQLKQGRQGSVVNPSLNLSHDNRMRELRNQLEMLGHKKIARLLGEWHEDLLAARRLDGDAARQRVLLAREISGEIKRAIEGI